ncbi:hypothetical protein G7Y89_g12668 [Cudoniella acicularis]|uniref:Uncharacterized protein n=1 Tax=Cudoniella acicularis TaxID=354080 RepID=A0A8H4R8D3_9HELO|nr:hypothetical protein G7Y89_g12668 [Cudoniella acicularis]
MSNAAAEVLFAQLLHFDQRPPGETLHAFHIHLSQKDLRFLMIVYMVMENAVLDIMNDLPQDQHVPHDKVSTLTIVQMAIEHEYVAVHEEKLERAARVA